MAASDQIAALRKALDELGTDYDLQVCDIFDSPEEAYEDAVVATPTLVKRLPMPARQIIGDLSNHQRIRSALEN